MKIICVLICRQYQTRNEEINEINFDKKICFCSYQQLPNCKLVHVMHIYLPFFVQRKDEMMR